MTASTREPESSASAAVAASDVPAAPAGAVPGAGAVARTEPRSRRRTRDLAAAALLTALMAASGWIAIPVGAVPVTLQVFPVVLAALLLPAEWAAASIGAYAILGAVGVPVFAHGQGGLGVLLGPTGGYIVGFVLGAWLGALVRQLLERRGTKQIVADVTAAIVVIVAVYVAGWIQLSIVLHLSAVGAFIAGVLPFVGLDAVKAAVAVGVASAVRRAGVRL